MKSDAKDLGLKLGLNSILRVSGHVLFNEIDLCTYSYQPKYARRQITDLDVVGFRWEPDLSLSVAVAECKGIEEKAMESLLKLQGTMRLFGASKGYFVQKRIDVNARELGRELGIYCLDEGNLGELITSVGVNREEYRRYEQGIYATKGSTLRDTKGEFGKAVDYTKYDFWTLPDHRNIINLMKILGLSAKKFKADNKSHRILALELCLLLTVAMLRLTGSILRLNCSNVPDGVKTLLLGGTRERRDREALFDEVRKVVRDEKVTPYPGYLAALTELLFRFSKALRYSYDVARCMEFFVGRACLGDNKGVTNVIKPFDDVTVKLTRDILYFVCEHAGLDKPIFANELKDDTTESSSDAVSHGGG